MRIFEEINRRGTFEELTFEEINRRGTFEERTFEEINRRGADCVVRPCTSEALATLTAMKTQLQWQLPSALILAEEGAPDAREESEGMCHNPGLKKKKCSFKPSPAQSEGTSRASEQRQGPNPGPWGYQAERPHHCLGGEGGPFLPPFLRD